MSRLAATVAMALDVSRDALRAMQPQIPPPTAADRSAAPARRPRQTPPPPTTLGSARGERWHPGEGNQSPYVFTDRDGHPIHPDQALEQFQCLTREADLPPIRLHDLRHGAATMARAGGVDAKILSAMLGHSSTTITNDLYGDVAAEAKREAANAIADQLADEDDE